MWLDNFCNSSFLNVTLSWYTCQPQLTICFEKTILVGIPCVFLWLFSVVEVYYYINSRTRNIPLNRFNIMKLVISIAICLLVVVRATSHIIARSSISHPLRDVDIYVPIIEFATFLLAAIHTELNRRMGLRTSGVLFIFWFFSSVLGTFKVYTIFTTFDGIDDFFKSYLIQYLLMMSMFVLNCFADSSPTYCSFRKSQNCCPEEKSSFLSRILFSWFTPLAWKGYKNPLETSDLWDLRIEDMSREVVPMVNKYWQITQMKCGSTKKASVLPALIKSFGLTNLMGAFLKFFQDNLMFVSPIVLKWLIDFVDNGEELWKGFLYAGILFSANLIQSLVLSQYFYKMFIIGVQVRVALISLIYRKSLKISSYSRRDKTIGEIVNLMAVDTQKFVDLLTYLNLIWSAPFQIIVCLYLLWKTLGISAIFGLTLLVILIPLNTYIVSKMEKFQIKQMEYKDERIKVTNEVLNGIKILKLYAWEPNFECLIRKLRHKELYELKKASFMAAGSNFIWTLAPFVVSFVTFATFIYVDEKNVLTADIAFVSISLFNILRFPMSMLPTLMSNIAQTAVSLKRINKFMNLPELDPANVTHDAFESGSSLVIENGHFSWGDNPILEDINVRLPKGSLTTVVGHVGSGKTSLISAFLGEMEKLQGRVNTIGTIAYVSQQAWIQNATIRNNILFGRKYNERYYKIVIQSCALTEDFKMMPGGDLTEIGEKGINLSGGQKQRINLARAVYAKRDVYLLDDPLSAVDCHVAKHLFDNVIGPDGLLKSKTRLLSTHSLTFLPHVDRLLVMKNGKISERGSYKELALSKGAFAEFLEQHIKNVASTSNDNELHALAQELEAILPTQMVAKKLQQISYQRSRSGSLESGIQGECSLSCSSSFRGRSSSQGSIFESEQNYGQLTEVEKVELGGVSLKVYQLYVNAIGAIICICIIISNILYQTFGIWSSFWLSKWSNVQSISQSENEYYLKIYGLLGIGQVVTNLLLVFTFAQGFYQSSVKAHEMLLISCLHALQSFFDMTPLGRILNRFSYDLNCIDNTLPVSVYEAVTKFFVLSGTLFVVTYNSPLFLLIIALTGFVYFFIQRIYQATCRQLKRMESVSRSPIYSFFSETLTGTSIIRAYVQQERFIIENDKRIDANQVCYFYGLVANRWLAIRLELIANLIILFAALFTVLSRDSLSPGIVGLSVSYALQITQTLNWLVRMICDVETNIVSIERIKEYCEAPQEAPWVMEETDSKKIWPEKGNLRFEKYSVRYRTGLDLVLKDINVSICGGEKVGIVGRTGAGKSSLTLSLFRIIEAAAGSIYIDDIDISTIGLHTLRSKITIIPQDAVLFSGTLRMNLDPYNRCTDEEIWKSLEHAHLKQFFSNSSGGLLQKVNEGGENFSIGQKQLICLSRALLRKSKLLVLDEATAAVDLQTDDFIQKTIRTEFRHCTILTIAHRLNTIMDYDKIIVLDKGFISEFDTPQNLIDKRGIFYSMCKEANLI